ncbi:MAG TPA: hydrogenase maturation protein [Gammaproteobacteria bacterium]|nr:hydrogenase maturation protein [Gammaproteobacteria bacterium]
MRILLLTHSFNSLTQRLHVELRERGHQVSVEYDINDQVTVEAVDLFRPDLVVAPFLKRAIPESVWRRQVCLIVHPGIPGDRGPSALDRAILEDRPRWGVTVLQAEAGMDAGPVWAWRGFPMRAARKSSLYRFEVTEAAAGAVLEAIERFRTGAEPTYPDRLAGVTPGRWHDPVRQAERRIDWEHDDTATVVRRINAGDGAPGVADEILGQPCRLFDAHTAPGMRGRPGGIVGRAHGAVCRATRDGAVWIGHLRATDGSGPAFKLPAARVLGRRLRGVPAVTGAPAMAVDPVRYEEHGPVGLLHFDFYNGAMGTAHCRRLLAAWRAACRRPTRVIVLAGGTDFWCNGLHLNLIEAAESPADESWRNINSMDDLAEAVITTRSHLTVAAVGGNAGAGGAYLALAADHVALREGVTLNPHYRNMGNLYGSEYWTYLLPRRVGQDAAAGIMRGRLPMGAAQALRLGLADSRGAADPARFREQMLEHALALAGADDYAARLEDKDRRLARDTAARPLQSWRDDELAHMRLNFYGFDPSYHVARHRFVHQAPRAWTPRHLALHRRLGWTVPDEPGSRTLVSG